MCDWITEKSEKLENDDLAKDLTTVKALQRKHKGIERELAPIKDKVQKRQGCLVSGRTDKRPREYLTRFCVMRKEYPECPGKQ